ncbi:MAG TPA: SDR family NAD(P)-dependent oxidoreductase [Solirubrobacteraceae bacterium]|jgi:NAD(P)-dependent dehydrogenase (short-subunit alcohol dehydrogenase family)|nr:SDR family NAD(P)-dependent oxidoreductase [Solirubrobacteraceae bacterium]
MDGKTVVVTGAARGIGRAIAERLAGAGAMVLCADVDLDELGKVASGIESAGGRAEAHRCDVSDPEAVEALMAAAEQAGGPHAIVSNAAIQYEHTIEDTPPEDWDRVIGVNLKGVYLCARAAIPRMRRLGGGSIVNMASVNGFWVEPQLGAYCTAKGGVINLTRSIALDFGKDGIRCNCICPGYIDTGMAQRYFEVQPDPAAARVEAGRLHALGRIGTAEEVAAMALFLCSEESSFCTAQPFIVDGGLSAGVAAT